MQSANKIIDFQEHLFNKDIDSRIKSSRDDTLKIIQADIKVVGSKIDKLDESVRADIKVLDSKVDGNFELLDAKIDNNFELLNAKIDKLDESVRADIKVLDSKVDNNFDVLNTKIDKNFEVLNTKIDGAVNMRKWVVGILITILLAIVIQIAPGVVAFFS